MIATARATTAGSASGGATTSTSAMSGAGLKKCRPMTRLRPGRRLGDLGDRERARVGGQDRLGLGHVIERPEDRPLQLQVLERATRSRGRRRRPARPGSARGAGGRAGPSTQSSASLRIEAELRRPSRQAVADPLAPALERPRRRRRRGRPRSPPRGRPARSPRPSSRHRRCRRSPVAVAGRPRRGPAHQTVLIDSNGWRQSRAVADRPALGRPEQVLHDGPSRAAVRARDARLQVDEGRPPSPVRARRRRRDPGGGQSGASRRADPIGGPGHLERGRDLDRPAEGREPVGDRRLDQLERRAADEGRQDLDPDRAVVGATSTRWTIPRSTTDSIGSSGSITSARAARDGGLIHRAGPPDAPRPAIAPARGRAIPICVPASLTRSLRGRSDGRS